jgi:hypothetical protein
MCTAITRAQAAHALACSAPCSLKHARSRHMRRCHSAAQSSGSCEQCARSRCCCPKHVLRGTALRKAPPLQRCPCRSAGVLSRRPPRQETTARASASRAGMQVRRPRPRRVAGARARRQGPGVAARGPAAPPGRAQAGGAAGPRLKELVLQQLRGGGPPAGVLHQALGHDVPHRLRAPGPERPVIVQPGADPAPARATGTQASAGAAPRAGRACSFGRTHTEHAPAGPGSGGGRAPWRSASWRTRTPSRAWAAGSGWSSAAPSSAGSAQRARARARAPGS